jgi:hypothetical protein
MDQRVAPLASILRLNARLLRNCLDGLTDEQARRRPSDHANSATFVAAHLAESRFFLLKTLGRELANPLAPYLEGARGIGDVRQLPSLAEIGAAWTAVSDALLERLSTVSAAELEPAMRYA